MRLYDRLKLTEDFLMTNGIMLKKGYIGTCKNIDHDNQEYTLQIAIPIDKQYSCTPYISTMVALSDLILDTITQEELDEYLNTYGYEYITSRIFHINNIWSIKSGYDNDNKIIYRSGMIMQYNVALNENDDTILFKFFDDESTQIYKKRYLDKFGSYSIID